MPVHTPNDSGEPDPRGHAELREPDGSDDGWSVRSRLLATGLFAAIALLIGVDVVDDLASGAGAGHIGLEIGVFALAMVGVAALVAQVMEVRRRAQGLVRDLAAARAEASRWRQGAEETLRGLGAAIDLQFERWGLSTAEREVALLLLKGLSLREIAGVRTTSERTVRQQSLAVYRKAGLSGRAALSAFFLEDLLLPHPPKVS